MYSYPNYYPYNQYVQYPIYSYFPVVYPTSNNVEIPVKADAWEKLSKDTKKAVLKELGIV
jgi:hypothetical protein